MEKCCIGSLEHGERKGNNYSLILSNFSDRGPFILYRTASKRWEDIFKFIYLAGEVGVVEGDKRR